ncbi:MAG: hypothetical protein ABSE75_07390 [Acidimicrobiales bacterium]
MIKKSLEDLRHEFDGIFDEVTVEHFVVDSYEIVGLGVKQNASMDQIKEAYFNVVKFTRPDNSRGLAHPAWFAAATKERDTLAEHENRCAHDAWIDGGTRNPISTSSSPTSPKPDFARQTASTTP